MGIETNMKKVVICGASGLKNSGDEAILYKIISDISSLCSIAVISLDKEYTKRIHPDIDVLQSGSKESKRAIEECDIFILGGGGLLQDETSIYNCYRWIRYLRIALNSGCATYLYANSVGPIHFGFNRKIVAKYLNKVNTITLRDEESATFLNSIGVLENIYVTADPVFGISLSGISAKENQLDMYDYAICIRHWFDTNPMIPVKICTMLHIRSRKNCLAYEKYVNEIAELVKCFSKNNKSFMFVSFLYERDRAVAKDICLKAGIEQECIWDCSSSHPMEYLRFMSKSKVVVGMRLHSIIYSILLGKPFVAIAYSDKVRALVRYAGCESLMVDIKELSTDKLLKKVADAESPEYIEKIEKARLKMQTLEEQNLLHFKKMVEVD